MTVTSINKLSQKYYYSYSGGMEAMLKAEKHPDSVRDALTIQVQVT